MRKSLAIAGVLALGLSAIVIQPAAAKPDQLMACTPYANNVIKISGTVQGAGGQTGSCSSVVNVLMKRQRTGPDQVLKSGSRSGAGGLTLFQACDWGSASYGIYMEAYSDSGLVKSDVRQITC